MDRWVALYRTGALGLPLHLKDREVVFRRGDEADACYFLRDGAVELLQSSEDGKAVLVKILVGPTLFGAIEPLGGEPLYLETVRVLEKANVVRLTRARFLQLVSEDAEASFECLKDVGKAFCVAAQLEPARLFPADAQLAAVLLAYADACGDPCDDGVHMRVKRTQEDLAQAIGGGERSVNRFLTEWKSRGLVSKRTARYLVHDLEGLRLIAGSLSFGLVHRLAPRGVFAPTLGARP